MGKRSMTIKGADDYATNSDGNNYLPTKQVTTNQTFVDKVSIYCPSTNAGPVYVWLLDTAAGGAASTQPKHVRVVNPGVADTWDLGPGGSLFKAGVYVVAATNEPLTPATTPTAAANNAAQVAVDFRG